MKGFRVEGQQLGAAQTETMAHPDECRHFGMDTPGSCIAFKSQNIHEDPGFGGPIPVTVGHGAIYTTTEVGLQNHGPLGLIITLMEPL